MTTALPSYTTSGDVTNESEAILERLVPRRARLTHINHELDSYSQSATMNALLANDQDVIEVA